MTRSLRLPLAPLAAAALLAGLQTSAFAENWPVYVTGTQRVTHDSNLFRRDTNIESDVLSTTSATVGIDKSYGRQTYRASLTGGINRYSSNDQLDNNSYSLTGDIISTLGREWLLQASLSRSRALASFDDANDRQVEKNLRDSLAYSLSMRYGLYGALSIGANFSRFETEHTASSSGYPNQENDSFGIDFRYTPRDQLSFSVGFRHVPGRLEYGGSGSAQTEYETSTDNIDFGASWEVSGLSRLDARLSYSQQKKTDPGNGSGLTNQTEFSGWTGSAAWRYSPRGRLVYTASIVRDTSNNLSDTRFDPNVVGIDRSLASSADDRVLTRLSGNVRWEASAKLSLSANAAFEQRETQLTFNSLGLSRGRQSETGKYASVGLDLDYTPQRWLRLGCGIDYIKRTADLVSTVPYTANLVSCYASATLNAQN